MFIVQYNVYGFMAEMVIEYFTVHAIPQSSGYVAQHHISCSPVVCFCDREHTVSVSQVHFGSDLFSPNEYHC